MTTRDEFEKWYDNLVMVGSTETVAEWAWQAAKAECEKEIARLGLLDVQTLDSLNEEVCKENDRLRKEIAELKDTLIGYDEIMDADDKRIVELQTENQRLREALLVTQDSLSQLIHHGMEQWAKDKANDAYEYIEEALATHAQSLKEHDENSTTTI